jgi:uncharacterized LabA/DUF88 family protein
VPENRVTFIIDGFNLYHSLRSAQKDTGGASTKWLNIRELCASRLYLLGGGAALAEIYYFSALAHHRNAADPRTTERHQAFLDCIKSTGVITELARFKPKEVWCEECGKYLVKHEEKETDVALSTKLIEVLWKGECETAIMVTGDTDISPAIRFAQKHFPEKKIGFLFPYNRHNRELAKMTPGMGFKIGKDQYLKYQFPDEVVLFDGSIRKKPAAWEATPFCFPVHAEKRPERFGSATSQLLKIPRDPEDSYRPPVVLQQNDLNAVPWRGVSGGKSVY